jgi:hypothetical protein
MLGKHYTTDLSSHPKAYLKSELGRRRKRTSSRKEDMYEFLELVTDMVCLAEIC